MVNLADEPLKKVTLNLYDADVTELAQRYGWGWSEQVRRLVRRYLVNLKQVERAIDAEPIYLGDPE